MLCIRGGFLILYECLALLRSFHVQCHIKPLAQGAASRRRSLPPAFGERLGDFNATNTRAVCNVEDKTTRADNMPMLINRVFQQGPVNQTTDNTADNWHHPEEPQLL